MEILLSEDLKSFEESFSSNFYVLDNLNTVGVDNISTSDEESEPVVKPAVPPRSRPGNFENGHPSVVPRRLLNNKEKTRGKLARLVTQISFRIISTSLRGRVKMVVFVQYSPFIFVKAVSGS